MKRIVIFVRIFNKTPHRKLVNWGEEMRIQDESGSVYAGSYADVDQPYSGEVLTFTRNGSKC